MPRVDRGKRSLFRHRALKSAGSVSTPQKSCRTVPRFVILEHRWNGIHWDLMLEVEQTLRTWAIDSPIQPGVELSARLLADHRLAYLDYEGEISGGRGRVSRLDRGEYQTADWSDRCVRVELRGTHFRGRVTLNQAEGQSEEDGGRWWCRFEEGNLD
jgi:hypothetical protein